MTIEMKVAALTFDEATQAPILLLKALDGDQSLPIYIGLIEATSIAMQLEEIELVRPQTHDLLQSMLTLLGGSLLRVEINDIQENTYYASLFISANGAEIEIDSRPSDALALALRMKAPIFVHPHVLADSKPTQIEAARADLNPDSEEDSGKWTELLENLDPEAFGKYKM